MTIDFEHDLREALRDEAARAHLADDWTPDRPIDRESPHRSRWVLATAACLIVMVGVAGIVVATQRDAAPVPASVSGTTVDGPDEMDAPTTVPAAVPPVSTVPVPTTVDPTPRFGSTGIALGDSRMLGAASQLTSLGFTVDAFEGRQFADVVGIVQRLSETEQLPEVMVIDVGNNGTIRQDDLDTLMALLSDVPTVVMLTTPIDRDWVEPNNALIASLPATYPNVTTLDFATEAAECPGDCFYADNLHLKADGQLFYANLIADAVGIEPEQPASSGVAVETTDTVFMPPIVDGEGKTLTFAEVDTISNDASGRRTVALERAADGTVLWWMTVWTGTTPSGVEVLCTASRSGGHGCGPDNNDQPSHPVQVRSFSMQAPSALTLLATNEVTSLRAVLDDAEPVEIPLVDIGLRSGKQAAGLYLGDSTATTIRFDATLADGSTYSFHGSTRRRARPERDCAVRALAARAVRPA